jgi:hypothetical protein
MSLAQVSLEVEQQGPHGQWRRRLSVTLDCDDSEKLERHSPPHLTASSPDTLAAITSPNQWTDEFDDRVGLLVANGWGRERARHFVAVGMKLPDEEIARLREAAS